jgi:hypothetical protein
MEADLTILRKETGITQLEAESLYQKCGEDVVEAILCHQGFQPKPSNFTAPELTEAQQKIKELRDIVNQKDERMDNIIAQNRVK